MLWPSNIRAQSQISAAGRDKTQHSCPPPRCQDVPQVVHSSTDCPAGWVCCFYRHGRAVANHKSTFSTRVLNTQQGFTNLNCPLQVKELYKLFLGFIYLLLTGQRMPFAPSVHVGKSVLLSYTKRLTHPHFGVFFKEE